MTGADTPQTPPAPRRKGRQFRHAADTLRKRFGAAAARRGFAEPEVLTRWDEVIGTHLASFCQPVKISYGRSQGFGATLYVEALGGRAPEIEHQAPQILERINQFYGYRAVSRLKITQAAELAGFAEGQAAFIGAKPPAAPSPEHRAQAETMAEDVTDPGLRQALADLGAWVLTRAPDRPR